MCSDNEVEIDLPKVEHVVGAVLRVARDDRLDSATIKTTTFRVHVWPRPGEL